MDKLIKRWQRAAQRADEEQVRVVFTHGEYRAPSASQPLVSYHLQETPLGWTCECPANRLHGLPCKHLAALARVLDLDVLSDVYVAWDDLDSRTEAA